MKQKHYIQKINEALKTIETIRAALLIGSFGRNSPGPNSDINYQLLVKEEFDPEEWSIKIKELFPGEFKHHLWLEEKQILCFYLSQHYIPIEFSLDKKKEKAARKFLTSEIYDPEKVLILDRTGELLPYLKSLIKEKQTKARQIKQKTGTGTPCGYPYPYPSPP